MTVELRGSFADGHDGVAHAAFVPGAKADTGEDLWSTVAGGIWIGRSSRAYALNSVTGRL